MNKDPKNINEIREHLKNVEEENKKRLDDSNNSKNILDDSDDDSDDNSDDDSEEMDIIIDDDSDDENDIEEIDIIPDDSDDDSDNDSDDDSDDDSDGDNSENLDDETVYFKFNTTKHKLEGKHSLKRDTIFQGKLETVEEEDMYSSTSEYYNKDFPIEKGTSFEMESKNFEELENQRNLKRDIYDLLNKNTNVDFSSNRRKPNKQAFNSHYEMLLKNLNKKYTKSEIFVELSYYFTDHIFNVYKLLYPEHATNIIIELRDKGFLDELDDMKFI